MKTITRNELRQIIRDDLNALPSGKRIVVALAVIAANLLFPAAAQRAWAKQLLEKGYILVD